MCPNREFERQQLALAQGSWSCDVVFALDRCLNGGLEDRHRQALEKCLEQIDAMTAEPWNILGDELSRAVFNWEVCGPLLASMFPELEAEIALRRIYNAVKRALRSRGKEEETRQAMDFFSQYGVRLLGIANQRQMI